MKLFEGRYDAITGILVDAIWVVIKKSKNIYDENGNELYATQTQKTEDFKFQIIIKREKDFNAYKLDANTYHNKIVFSLTIDPDIEPDYYSELNVELQGTVRHELEHLLQEKGVLGKAKFPSKYMLDKINKDDYTYLISDHETEAMIKGFYRIAKTQKEKLDVVIDDFLRYYTKEKILTKKQAKEIKDKWITYAKANLPKALYKKITETQHFTRGLDPKEAMGIGLTHHLRKALLNPDSGGQEEISDWLRNNPTLAQALQFDFENPNEYKNIVGLEIDYYCENINPDVDEEDLKKEFKKIKTIKTGGINPTKSGILTGEVNVVIGKLVDDDSKVIYYYGGLVSGYIARKEWLGINEAQHFTRGLDPKDAMQTGDIIERARQSIQKAIIKLAEKYSSYPIDEISVAITDNIIKYGFHKTFELEIWHFYIGYSKIDYSFRISNWFAGWIKVNETWQNKQPVEGQPLGNTQLYYNDLDKCIKKLENKLKESVNEDQHFTRGLDPKDAMKTGDIATRIFKKGCEQTQKAIELVAKENGKENETYIEEIEGNSYMKMFGFHMTPTLEYNIHYTVWLTGKDSHFSHEQYCASFSTPNNPNGEDGTSNDYCFNNLKNAINTIIDWITDGTGDEYDYVRESQHFTRGLDPKDAMGIGIKPAIIQAAKDAKAIGQVGSIFFDISEEILGDIIDFLLDEKYSVEQIKRLILQSRHIEWSFTSVHYYDVDTFKRYYKNNMNTIKEFLKGKSDKGLVKEAQHFTRGLDPKDAMSIGDVKSRQKRKELIEVIKDFDANLVWEIDEQPYYQFIAWDGDETEWIDNILEDADYNLLKSLYNKLEEVKSFNERDLDEAQHFTRGLDPKDAMSVGDVEGRKIEKAKREIHDAIKQLAKENKVDTNSIEWPYDGIGLGFTMPGSFIYFIDYDREDGFFGAGMEGKGSVVVDYTQSTTVRQCMKQIRNWIIDEQEKE